MHFKNPFKTEAQRSRDRLQKEPLYDYEVGQTLGEGGYGTVKRAHRKGEEAGVDVAVKIISRSHITSKNDVKEILRRFSMMQSLGEHPHIVKLFDYRVTKTTLFAFYEYCRGKDLFDRILDRPSGKFTEAQSREATLSLTDAIAYVHGRGLIHRDIKPENCLYRVLDGPYGDLVLADFGLSKECTPDEIIQGAAGSPGYWSPEMCQGKGYNMLADEFALGIVVYAMLSGRSPYKSLESEDLRKECARGHVNYPAKYWNGISEDAQDFVQKLLEPDPTKRMTAREALQHRWLTETPAEAAHADAKDDAQSHTVDAGRSMRFDKPKEKAPKASTAAASPEGPQQVISSVTSPKIEEEEGEEMHIVNTEDVLKGNISHDKLVLLAKLDESHEVTPISSRDPSHADLQQLVEHLKDSGIDSDKDKYKDL